MSPVLDLGPLDRALAGLVDAVSGAEAEEVLLTGGEEFASAWRSNIEATGLVESGRYRDSIRVEPLETKRDIAAVQIGTDAVDDKGFPYPVVLEYGRSDLAATPVGIQAFDQKRRSVVKAVGAAVDRKVRSRARRK